MRTLLAAALVAAICAASFASETDDWIRFGETRALSLEKQGRFEEAIEEWISVAHVTPGDARPFVRAAVLAVELPVYRGGELSTNSPMFGSAQQCVRNAMTRWGQGDPGLAYVIGRLEYAQQQWGPAARDLLEAQRGGFDPVRTRFWSYRAIVNRSVKLIDNNRGQEALDDLLALRKAQPGHPDEHFLILDLAAAHRTVQEHDAAMKLLDDEIAKNPGAADALYIRGQVLAEEGRLADAEESYRKSMLRLSAGDKTYRDALLRLGEVYIKMNRLDDAEVVARQYLALAKDAPEGLFLLGRVEQGKNQLDEALKHFRRVARMDPDAMDTLVNLRQVLFQLGLSEEGDKVQKRIEEIQRRRNEEIAGTAPPPANAPAPANPR